VAIAGRPRARQQLPHRREPSAEALEGIRDELRHLGETVRAMAEQLSVLAADVARLGDDAPASAAAEDAVDEALRAYADALSAARPSAVAGPVAGKRVLIVGIGAREAFALADALETGGLEVAFAEDAAEALERLASPGADLVLVDAAAGESTLSAVRAAPAHAAVPVVALAPEGAHDAAARRLVAGATGYLRRPVDVDGLLPLIRTWLGR